MEQLVTACLELGAFDKKFMELSHQRCYGWRNLFSFPTSNSSTRVQSNPSRLIPNADGHRGLCNYAPNLDRRPSSEDPGNYAWVSHGSPLGGDLANSMSSLQWSSAALPQSIAERLRNFMANKGACRVNGRHFVWPSRVYSMTRTRHWAKGKPSPNSMHQAMCNKSAATTRG